MLKLNVSVVFDTPTPRSISPKFVDMERVKSICNVPVLDQQCVRNIRLNVVGEFDDVTRRKVNQDALHFCQTIYVDEPIVSNLIYMSSFIVIMGTQTAGKRCGRPFREVSADKSQTAMTSRYYRPIRASFEHTTPKNIAECHYLYCRLILSFNRSQRKTNPGLCKTSSKVFRAEICKFTSAR